MDDYSVYFQTSKSKNIRMFVCCITRHLDFRFTPEGLRDVLVDLLIDAQKLDKYFCPQPITVTCSLPLLCIEFKKLDTELDLIIFINRNDPNNLHLAQSLKI